MKDHRITNLPTCFKSVFPSGRTIPNVGDGSFAAVESDGFPSQTTDDIGDHRQLGAADRVLVVENASGYVVRNVVVLRAFVLRNVDIRLFEHFIGKFDQYNFRESRPVTSEIPKSLC